MVITFYGNSPAVARRKATGRKEGRDPTTRGIGQTSATLVLPADDPPAVGEILTILSIYYRAAQMQREMPQGPRSAASICRRRCSSCGMTTNDISATAGMRVTSRRNSALQCRCTYPRVPELPRLGSGLPTDAELRRSASATALEPSGQSAKTAHFTNQTIQRECAHASSGTRLRMDRDDDNLTTADNLSVYHLDAGQILLETQRYAGHTRPYCLSRISSP
jgi:hypothetical protein